MKIFIIDDDNLSIFMTSFLLEREKSVKEVCSFLSAEEALKDLLEDDIVHVPDIILLDLNMPHMSGWDFMDAVAPYKERFTRCSVFVLTSSLALADTAKAKEYELIRGFLHKPLDEANVQAVLSSRQATLGYDAVDIQSFVSQDRQRGAAL